MSLTTMRSDSIVYWAPGAPDGDGGWTYSTAVQIKGRWQDKVERIDNIDESFMSSAVVYTDQDVSQYGWLWKGLLADLPSQDPQAVPAAYRIRQVEDTESPGNSLRVWKVII